MQPEERRHSPEMITDLLCSAAAPPKRYSPPVKLDMSVSYDRDVARDLVYSGNVRIIDPVVALARDLHGIRDPKHARDVDAREAYVADFIKKRRYADSEDRGSWFHFPYDGTLVYYASRDDHHLLRTDRNIGALTRNEQVKISEARIAFIGLSIGSNAARECRRSAIGGDSLLFDPDVISPTNLNRLDADESDVGVLKTHHVAMANSRANPWSNQVLFDEGLNDSNISSLADNGISVAIDEMDDFSAKALLREYARGNSIPIVMATDLGDRVQLDVERHDLGPVEPFNGRVKPIEVLRLMDNTLTPEAKKKLMKRIVGIRNMNARMIKSIMEVGSTRASLPQLGTTASLAGVVAAVASREIILGRDLGSGRYVLSPRRVMRLRSETRFPEALQIYASIPAYMRRPETPM